MKTDVLLIDFNTIAMSNWFAMFSDSHEATKGDELSEWVYLTTKYFITLIARTDPTKTIIAMDCKGDYWRHDLVNDFYHTHITFLMNSEDSGEWYSFVDGTYHRIYYVEAKNGWDIKKLTNKKYAEETLGKDFIIYEEGNTPKEILEAYADVPKHISEFPIWKSLKQVIHYYKGSRSNAVWKAKTSKEDFAQAKVALAKKLADTFGAKFLMVDKAEADDIIAAMVTKFPKNEVVLVSSDHDLYQFWTSHDSFQYLNTQSREFVTPMTKEQALYSKWCKILGGDSSDYIQGVMKVSTGKPLPIVKFRDGVVTSGKGTVKVLDEVIESVGIDNVEKHLTEGFMLDEDTLKKNITLVDLNKIPVKLLSDIEKAYNDSKNGSGATFEEYGLSDKDVALAVKEGRDYNV